ncbi:hypothetical protein [Xanthomonas arboricola]|uniref:hypothetical protein n=1 Tax=Xanthomonas arboricola TaxID=56448 RepID=UPI0011B045C9|nr:hypothetical protein [Xanthomonas arboricola]
MIILRDSLNQPYIEWAQGPNGFKRAWVQDRSGTDKDWAASGRYINVVRIERLGTGPAGNATDFPVFSPLLDEQLLIAFVTGVSAITGCALEWSKGDA